MTATPDQTQRGTASDDSRQHVAVVVPSLSAGGAERVAGTLAREFARSVHVTVVTCEPRLSAAEVRSRSVLPWSDQVPEGCRHVHLPSTGAGTARLVPLALRLAVLARRERFDAVFSFLTWTNVLVALARLLGGRYVHVASEHAMAESLRSDGRGLALLARALPLLYRLPDRLVVVSDAARRSLAEAGVLPRPDRALTIPNPVDAEAIAVGAGAACEADLPDTRPLIACLARLHPQKDHRTLLEAMTLLTSDCTLALAGDGPHRPALEGLVAELGLGDRVVFLGALDNPFPLIRAADVVVLPSAEEGFGLVAVEAAALGTPFVGSDVGGLGELCASLGQQTFPAGDHVALARAVAGALAHPGRRQPLDVSAFAPARVASAYLDLVGPASRVSP